MDHKEKELSVPQAVLLGACIIAVAVLVAAFIVRHGGAKESPSTDTATATDGKIPIGTKGEPFFGNPDAKLAVAYWCDFQAISCKQTEEGPIQEVIKKYVASGNVAIVYKDLPQFGDDSTTAALYGRAVWALYPDKYVAFRTALFAAQDRVNEGFGNERSIVELLATVPGINADRVRSDVLRNREKYMNALEVNAKEAAGENLTGSPAFLINGEKVLGATTFEALAKNIDAGLSSAQ